MADIKKIKIGDTEYDVKDASAVALPTDEAGAVVPGADGQFAVSDGAGGIRWVDIPTATGVSF